MNIQIQLPASLNDYAQSQVAAGRFSSVDEFFIALVQADQVEQQIHADLDNNPRLEKLLEESLTSGPGRIVDSSYFDELKAKLIERHSGKQ